MYIAYMHTHVHTPVHTYFLFCELLYLTLIFLSIGVRVFFFSICISSLYIKDNYLLPHLLLIIFLVYYLHFNFVYDHGHSGV